VRSVNSLLVPMNLSLIPPVPIEWTSPKKQESGMKNKIREQRPTKPTDESVKGTSIDVNTELGEEELSKAAGGACVKGEHIPKVKINI